MNLMRLAYLYSPRFLIAGLICVCACMLKVSFLVGSYHLSLNGFSLFFPILGSLLMMQETVALFILRLAVKVIFGGIFPVTFYLPTLAATGYLKLEQSFIKIIIPLICIILFAVHPVGSKAMIYTLFWLIPMICSFLPYLYARMLGSTFIAHAVGSVLWLYMIPMKPEQFISLMPIVCCERFLMAMIMTVSYVILKALYAYIRPRFLGYMHIVHS